MNLEQILPCPFCSGEPCFTDLDWERGYKAFVAIQCVSCRCRGEVIEFDITHNCGGLRSKWRRPFEDRAIAAWNKRAATPIDLLLFCPKCARQHVDEAKPDVCETCGGSQSECTCQTFTAWQNPPHKSHRCNFCNHVFRPADVPTNGVAAIKTKGERDGDPTPQNWIEITNDLLVKPRSPIADCPADIADDECICGVHAAQNRAINALLWAGEKPPFGVKVDEA